MGHFWTINWPTFDRSWSKYPYHARLAPTGAGRGPLKWPLFLDRRRLLPIREVLPQKWHIFGSKSDQKPGNFLKESDRLPIQIPRSQYKSLRKRVGISARARGKPFFHSFWVFLDPLFDQSKSIPIIFKGRFGCSFYRVPKNRSKKGCQNRSKNPDFRSI